jgi:ribulose-phosphate 3-epimerase
MLNNLGDPVVLLHRIRQLGMRSGIALKPGTPISTLDKCFELASDRIDMILIMTVEPGFGGQSYMPEMMEKVKAIRRAHPKLNIQVDGGLSLETINHAASAGANVIVAGSAIFGASQPEVVIQKMREIVQTYCKE